MVVALRTLSWTPAALLTVAITMLGSEALLPAVAGFRLKRGCYRVIGVDVPVDHAEPADPLAGNRKDNGREVAGIRPQRLQNALLFFRVISDINSAGASQHKAGR